MSDPITRRLALAAFRLSVFTLGFALARAKAENEHFARLAAWVGVEVGTAGEEQLSAAMREAVAALVEAGEVASTTSPPTS